MANLGRAVAVVAVLAIACAGRRTGPGGGGGAPGVASPDAGLAPVVVAVPEPTRCVAGAPRAEYNPYDRARALQDDDGTFTDACDAHGDLVSYQCEERDCGGGGGDDRHPVEACLALTGRVAATTIDCDGQCQAGACAMRCPRAGDRFTFARLDRRGNAVFDSDSDRRRIACDLAFDQRDGFDCAADHRVGEVMVVAGLGMSTTTCTGGVWGAVSDARCSYAGCHFVY